MTCFHPSRCPDCPEAFPCACCGDAAVPEDGAWCSDCTDALDEFIAGIQEVTA